MNHLQVLMCIFFQSKRKKNVPSLAGLPLFLLTGSKHMPGLSNDIGCKKTQNKVKNVKPKTLIKNFNLLRETFLKMFSFPHHFQSWKKLYNILDKSLLLWDFLGHQKYSIQVQTWTDLVAPLSLYACCIYNTRVHIQWHWKVSILARRPESKAMVFCYQNCSDLLWEKIVPVIEKNYWNSRLKV